ncbi:putative oxidoreductase [Acetobacter indonesiensis NRIC 0313]|uniref:Aldo/keto reductase n=1 Tax=Acetobacter indonesiensis TaxID=104101 RepID=A0A6N3T9C9_9PROT|nr:aldo/keto reductase [Acetobacter indonesiensis]GAN64688.1 aldo/keto reductase [Acetobacter indonesiensis]GBQ58188.1 putative oxidoreductase [Acetobacter indonesiensis NRIC 0313]GEN04297.1 aldo/keto reductase [Acetobacter indonesiensis]
MPLDHFITLGRSGLRVSPLCLGTMTFGEDFGWGANEEDSHAMLSMYLDQGGNFIDTANIYTGGHSERIIGDYLHQQNVRRDGIVLSTKFFCNLFPGDPNGGGAGRKALLQQCEASLKRLQTDYIDIYWLHNWDQTAPVEETLRGLDDLVAAGKIRYIGFSDIPAWKTTEAQMIARFRGWAPIIALQLEYSLLERTSEGEHFPMARDLGMGIMPWSPLKSGFLSGKFRRGSGDNVDTKRTGMVGVPSEADYDIIEAVAAVAAEQEVSSASVALAWVRSRAGVSSTLIGARRIDQLQANLGSLNITLSSDQIQTLNDISRPKLNFPSENNETLAPMLAFPGMTVDGRTVTSRSF